MVSRAAKLQAGFGVTQIQTSALPTSWETLDRYLHHLEAQS